MRKRIVVCVCDSTKIGLLAGVQNRRLVERRHWEGELGTRE